MLHATNHDFFVCIAHYIICKCCWCRTGVEFKVCMCSITYFFSFLFFFALAVSIGAIPLFARCNVYTYLTMHVGRGLKI